jgi:hypothetical protein
VQSSAAFERLQRDGELVGDSSLGQWQQESQFADAYAWMDSQLRDRLGSHGEGVGMLWLWASVSRRALLADLRRSSGEVLLTVSIPRERVLLTDFDDWHAVLNRSLHVPVLEGETDAEWWTRAEPMIDSWNERADGWWQRPIPDWPPHLRAELERSWIPVASATRFGRRRSVQATTRRLLRDDVVRAVRLGGATPRTRGS